MELTIILGACLTCVAAGAVPWMPIEAAVVGAAVLLPAESLPLLVAATSLSQMSAKCVVYALARWMPERLPDRARAMLARAAPAADHRRLVALTVFVSALTSLPPFILVTLACGTTRVRFALYASGGFLGSALRYAVLAWGAQVVVAV